MILKIFTRNREKPATSASADQTQIRLDMLASDYALGKLTEQEYKALCRTVNDGAMAEAEQKLKMLENAVNGQ